MKIGIINEGKTPPDSRVPLTPKQCAFIKKNYPIDIVVQASPNRCYTDEEYAREGIEVTGDLSDCDVLMGVKEVPVEQLISHKIYFFFSHTIKKQAHNRKLLQEILKKQIQLVDYETLKNKKGERVIAFGRFAGMVGAHNGIMTYGLRTGAYHLNRMKDCKDYQEAKAIYEQLQLPPLKIVLTGTGRVSNGAARVLNDMGIKKVAPSEFLTATYDHPVFTQLGPEHYVDRKDGSTYETKTFYTQPQLFKSIFEPYTKVSDIMINGIYWDNRAPQFFSLEDMNRPDFNIKVIADVTCDIAPDGSIPSTLRASTIAEPIYGYDPSTGSETTPFQENGIDIMAIDNLPNELPRDASQAFGEQFIEHVIDAFEDFKNSEIINRATIAINGQLGKGYEYLSDYVVLKVPNNSR